MEAAKVESSNSRYFGTDLFIRHSSCRASRERGPTSAEEESEWQSAVEAPERGVQAGPLPPRTAQTLRSCASAQRSQRASQPFAICESLAAVETRSRSCRAIGAAATMAAIDTTMSKLSEINIKTIADVATSKSNKSKRTVKTMAMAAAKNIIGVEINRMSTERTKIRMKMKESKLSRCKSNCN